MLVGASSVLFCLAIAKYFPTLTKRSQLLPCAS